MKTKLTTVALVALVASGVASAQVNQFDGMPPNGTSLLDFDNPLVASGPISPTDAIFGAVGIESINVIGTWSVGTDTLTASSNLSGQTLITAGGVLAVGGLGEPLDGPGVDAGFDIQLSGPVNEFGVLFVDQINFDYTLELLLNGATLGIVEFPYDGSFPRDGHYWTATAGAFDQVVIRFQNGGGVGIDDIAFDNGFTPVGTAYCMANANSTGDVGVLTGTGSSTVADNSLTLTAADLPVNSFGFFLASTAQAFTPNPAGSSGNLCLGGSIGRYVGPGQIQNAGQAREFSLLLDLTMIPQPNGFVAAVAGQTWNFQAWYRDAIGGAPTSNFTQGLEVLFN